MSEYAVWFKNDGTLYKLPVNPEEIEINTCQAIEKYEILKLGQIAVPTHMELTEYSFETEFPREAYHYVETADKFKNADYYLDAFKEWREKLIPVTFIASNTIGDEVYSQVLIEELKITEKAGEEGDKYVSFKLIEYREYSKKQAYEVVTNKMYSGTVTKKKAVVSQNINSKSTGSHVVVSGDSLWAIAKTYYGDGSKYTKIYNVNKDKIKNPALIYAGQKLVIP